MNEWPAVVKSLSEDVQYRDYDTYSACGRAGVRDFVSFVKDFE